MMKILITDELHENSLKLLKNNTLIFEKISETKNFDVEAIILRTFTKLGKKEINKFPNLKHVVSCSVGIDNIDLETLKEKEIKLSHVPGTNANSVAEHALTLLLLTHRNILNKEETLFDEIQGKTFGFIGFGAVGKKFAKKLIGLEVKILIYDVVRFEEDLLNSLNAKQVSLDDVLKNSDIISIHVPLIPPTKKMINQGLFDKMKKGVIFLNTSRAEVVDETAFLNSLKDGTIKKAGLDVYSDELFEKLKKNDDVIITPHLGAKGIKSFENMCTSPIELFLNKINDI